SCRSTSDTNGSCATSSAWAMDSPTETSRFSRTRARRSDRDQADEPLQGITYDTADDLLDVSFDRLTHLIRHPRDIVIEERPEGVSSVAIALRDGSRQVIRLKQPLMVPATAGPRA